MKQFSLLFLLALFLSSNGYAFQSKIEIVEQFDDIKMVAFISMKDIKSNPEWNPNLTAAPLSVAEAIQAVKHFVKTSGTLNAIKEIEIRNVPKHDKQWHYLIKVVNNSMNSKFDIYVVLMSGKVIQGIIEPQGYK